MIHEPALRFVLLDAGPGRRQSDRTPGTKVNYVDTIPRSLIAASREGLLPFEGELAGQARSKPRERCRSKRLPLQARREGLDRSRAGTGRQADRVLQHLHEHGPSTDHELADALALPLASINSVRNALVKQRLVVDIDLVVGPFGSRRTRWGAR